MLSKVISHYKIQFIVAITLTIVLVAFSVAREVVDIVLISLGVFLGIFILDLDYFLYAYFIEPETDFSKSVTAFIKHGDVGNAVQFIHYHKNEIGDKTLNSILFQIALVALAIFGTSANVSIFIKALILSAFANSIYRLSEMVAANDYAQWFWALKSVPSNKNVIVYIVILFIVLAYCVTIF